MSKLVKDLYYSEEHEWIKVEGDVAYIGITDYAQDQLGDIVYVDCGTVGANVSVGDAVAVIESVKAASDVYSPLSGEIVKVNESLADAPETVNQDAFGNFLFAVKMSDTSELDALLDADAYASFCDK